MIRHSSEKTSVIFTLFIDFFFFGCAIASHASCVCILYFFMFFLDSSSSNMILVCNSVTFITFCLRFCSLQSSVAGCWVIFEVDFRLISCWFFYIYLVFSGARTNAKTLKLSSGLECRKIGKNLWLSSSLSKTSFFYRFTIFIWSLIFLYKLISHFLLHW